MQPSTAKILAILSLALAGLVSAADDAGEWRAYGADFANTHYSPLAQINGENVGQLETAWIWQSADIPVMEKNSGLGSFSFQGTPIMVGGVLYIGTSLNQVAAIRPGTGETIWGFDPESYKTGRPPNWGYVHRGITYWADGDDRRIYIGTGDARLIAIDARTGEGAAGFGANGEVDLKVGAPGLMRASQMGVTSPPVICRDVIVTGYGLSDIVRTKEMPRGQVRAFDVRTGEPMWTFDLVPQAGHFGNDTWEDDSWKYTGNTNAWAVFSADEELGYVYIPTSTPTSDWYGGNRLGDNVFAEGLLCLDARTGERVWFFQFVHHGLWDYDTPAAPMLVDITVNGKGIRAVAQITKQGFCYVFDRETGEPVWPIEERAVPQSDVPGEKSSPTQPFPTKPPPFERQGISLDDLIDFTPELRAEALAIVKPHRLGPLFTPGSLEGTIQTPGSSGGANWGGAAFDPETQLLYVPSITSPILVIIGEADPNRSNLGRVRVTPNRIEGPQGLPLVKPPYGRITAIDLNRGEIRWQVANGDGPRDHPLLKHLDLPPLGQIGRAGPLLTKSLLFVAEGTTATNSAGRNGGGTKFRAYDKASGEVVWETDLPANATGTPMTYLHGGKQYIVVAVQNPDYPAALVALSLP